MVIRVMNRGDDSQQENSSSSVHPGGERDCSDSDQGDEWGQ